MTQRHSFQMMLVLLGALGTSILSAHDEKNLGPATTGQIVSMADDHFAMKTAKGSLTVTLNKDTKFERSEKAVEKGSFKKGDKVTVYGTKLPTGELVAKEVMFGIAPAPKAMDHSKMDHSKMDPNMDMTKKK